MTNLALFSRCHHFSLGCRIDGRIVSTTGGGGNDDPTPLSRVAIEIIMAMGNCPKYLHVRDLVREEGPAPRNPRIEVGEWVNIKAPGCMSLSLSLSCCVLLVFSLPWLSFVDGCAELLYWGSKP